jgi:hypothetical protein
MSEILVYAFGFVLAALVLVTVIAVGRIDE